MKKLTAVIIHDYIYTCDITIIYLIQIYGVHSVLKHTLKKSNTSLAFLPYFKYLLTTSFLIAT